MGDNKFKSSILRAGIFLVIFATLFFSGAATVRAGFLDQAGSYFSEGSKTLGDATGKLGSGALNVWQKVGNGLGEAAGVVAKNTSQASDAFLGGIINFGETVGGLGNQVSKQYDAALGKVKQGTDKAVDAVVNILPKKESAKVVAPKPAVKNAAPQPATTEIKVLPTAPIIVQQKQETKKQSAPVAPKEIIIYSNKANQESVQPLVATSAKAASSGNAIFETVKSKGNVLVGDDASIDAATGVATLKGIKIIGTVDFTGADVKGFKQTVVNNYSSGSPMVVYNSTTKENESWQTLSGNIGGVSTHWSVGKDLTVSQNATVASILTIGSTSANGSLVVNGTGSFTGAASFTGALTLSSGATLSGDLTVNGNTTLGDASGDTITINGRLSTLNVSDGSTTSSLARNSFYVGDTANNSRGVFYVDSSGNTSVSGTLNLSNTTLAAVSSTAANLRLAADGSNQLELWTNAAKRFYINSSGNTFASGTLQVTNTSTLYNDLLVGASTESIADAGFIFNGNDLYVEDQLGVNGNAWFDGSIRASSTLLATDAVTFYGNSTFGDAVGDTISLNGTINTAVRASSTLLVGTAAGTDNLFISGNNTYVATSTAYGTAYTLIVGNGTTGALVAGGHAVPSHGSLFNLGSDSLRWSNIYSNTDNVSTTLYVGTGGTTLSTLTANNLAFAGSLGVVSSTAGNLRLAADGANQVRFWTNDSQRAYIDSSGNTFASGTLQSTGSILTFGNVTSTGIIYASNGLISSASSSFSSNVNVSGVLNASSTVYLGGNLLTGTGTGNSLDIGALNNAFRNIYASSSINVGASGASSTFMGNYLALTSGTSSTVLNGSSLTLGTGTGYSSGMFKVDSNGNVSASGSLQSAGGLLTLTGGTAITAGSYQMGRDADATNQMHFNVPTGATYEWSTNDTYGMNLSGGALVITSSFTTNSGIVQANNTSLTIKGWAANSGTAVGVALDAGTALSIAGAKLTSFRNAGTEQAYIDFNGGATFAVSSTLGYADGRFKVDSSGNVSASGSLYTFGNVTSTGHIYPATVNTVDLGGLNIAFRDVYASSSINVGVSGTSSTFRGNYLALTDGTSSTVLNASSLTLGTGTGYSSGMFKVDSNGNVSVSGTSKMYGTITAGTINGGTITGSDVYSSSNQFHAFTAGLKLKGWATAAGPTVIVGNAVALTSGNIINFTNDVGTFTTVKANIDFNGSYIVAGGGSGSTSSTLTANSFFINKTTNYDSGVFYVNSSGNVFASGSVYAYGNVTSTGHIYPAAVNTADLGALNTAFRNIYASSSINVGASGTSSTFMGNYLALTDGTTTGVLRGGSLQLGQATNFNGGTFAVSSNGSISTSGTLRVFASATATDNLGLLISVASTPAAASTTFTSYVGGSAVNGEGFAGFVFNTVGPYGALASSTTGVTNALLVAQNNGTNKFLVSPGGNVYAKNSFIANSTDYGIGDVAEYVNLVDGEPAEPGDVLVVDLINPNQYKKSSAAYTKEIAGVVSDSGAFIIGASGEGRAALALAGLVKTKVIDENGPIAVGDYLVSASKPGYAMKYDSASGKAAGLVGMALESLEKGEGKITIMVNKGLVAGSGSTVSLTVGENGDGTLSGGENWDFGGKNILNVKSISGANGLWFIDEKGLLMVKEIKADKVQAKKFVVEKENDLKKASVGEAVISQNNSSVVVENELVTAKTKIFVTFRSNPQSFWWISKQEDGKFEVSLSKSAEGDLTFDYWIVGVEEAPVPESETAPAAPVVVPVELPVTPAVEQESAVSVPVAPVVSEASPAPEVVAPAAEPVPAEVAPVSEHAQNL